MGGAREKAEVEKAHLFGIFYQPAPQGINEIAPKKSKVKQSLSLQSLVSLGGSGTEAASGEPASGVLGGASGALGCGGRGGGGGG